MPRQVYHCQNHGEFEVVLTWEDEVSWAVKCPQCGMASPWIPQAPNFIGGPTTGAGKGD